MPETSRGQVIVSVCEFVVRDRAFKNIYWKHNFRRFSFSWNFRILAKLKEQNFCRCSGSVFCIKIKKNVQLHIRNSLFYNVQRMEEKRVPLKLLHTNPEGNWRPGRLKIGFCWDRPKNMGITDWKTLSLNRFDWRSLLEEDKTNKRL